VAEITVCSVGDVDPGAARRIDVDGHRLCVVHVEGDGCGDGREWHVVADECSHADYSLAEGELWSDECAIECPQHGSTFSLLTGEPQSLPATRPVAVYPVRVAGDDVVVTIP
jgi:3-phenylpropionate/trans-cinnamate dioxygenase ferredoxin component